MATGGAPVPWSSAIEDGGDLGHADARRRLGQVGAGLDGITWLPDDLDALRQAIDGDGRAFNGAKVPLVIHDPVQAERSFDAAEWACDLIKEAGGRYFEIITCADSKSQAEMPLAPRHWNHAAAMIERLDGSCRRFGLTVMIDDRVGEVPAREDDVAETHPPPIHYALDAGSFVPDGFSPVRFISPVEQTEPEGLSGRLRGLLGGG